MNSTVKTSGRFAKLKGLRASVPFFPLPTPFLPPFCSHPIFRAARNVKFRSLRTGTLATQATMGDKFEWKQHEQA